MSDIVGTEFYTSHQVADMKAEITALRKKVEALEDWIVSRLDTPESLPAPCVLCGHNGPNYYQPDSHACKGNANYREALQPNGEAE